MSDAGRATFVPVTSDGVALWDLARATQDAAWQAIAGLCEPWHMTRERLEQHGWRVEQREARRA